MLKNLKNKLSNEKGFTLIEILVVISIIAILFVILLPQIDFAGDKARQAGVKTDFHTFQIASESYLREIGGKDISEDGLNNFLDKAMRVAGGISGKEDPWNAPYELIIGDNDNRSIVVTSVGKNEGKAPANTTFVAGADFLMATYYKQGEVGSCTAGFETNNIKSDLLGTGATAKKCGDKIDEA